MAGVVVVVVVGDKKAVVTVATSSSNCTEATMTTGEKLFIFSQSLRRRNVRCAWFLACVEDVQQS